MVLSSRGEDDVFIGAEDVAGAFFGQGAGVGDGEIDIAGEKLGFEGGARSRWCGVRRCRGRFLGSLGASL